MNTSAETTFKSCCPGNSYKYKTDWYRKKTPEETK